MPKVLKYLLLALAGLVALLVLAVAIIAATFNPNDYKPTLIKLVQDKTQRTLSIPGDIKLTFFPRLGADLGKVAISERQNARVFASAEHAQVALALMPIFSRQFIIDQILVDGLVVNLHRYKNDTTNYDDLLPTEDGNAQPATANTPTSEEAKAVQFDLGGVSLTNASLGLTDETKNSTLTVSKLNLRTGPIAQGKKSNFEFSAEVKGNKPQLALTVNAKSNFTLDLAQQRHVFDGFSASLKGAAADIPHLQMSLSAPSFELSPQALMAPALALEAAITQGARSTTAKLGGTLSGDLTAQRFELSNLNLEAALPSPAGGTLALSAKGKASVNLPREAVQASLSGKIDGIRMEAQLGLSRFSPPAYSFDIALDDLDADRYLAKSTPVAKTESATPNSETSAAPRSPAPESPPDLSALQSLDARGTLKVASLKFANIRTSNVRLELHAVNGKVNINPMTASLYGGSLAGSLSASASKTPRFSVQQTLRNINIGPLLKDALDKNPVDGKGDVTIDISATGATVSQLKRAINGTARLALQDGALNGINLAATIRDAKTKIGLLQGQPAPQQGSASTQEKTDFTELSGSFKIANGVAHNDDLSAKTPLLRIGGNGDINLGEDRLDYTVKATVVSTLQGQGGPELQQLKGLTVPVKLSGPFNAIRWEVDFGSLAGDLVKGKVEAEVQKQVDTQKGQVEQQLKDQLKGLFGK